MSRRSNSIRLLTPFVRFWCTPLWWHKPLDITEPAILAAESAPGLAATLWACSRRETAHVRWIEKDLAQVLRTFCDEPDSAEQLAPSSAGDPEQEYSITIIETETRRKTTYNLIVHDLPHPITFTVYGNGEKNAILLLMMPGANALLCPLRLRHGNTGVYDTITLSHLVRWQLLRRFVHDQPLLAALLFREEGVRPGKSMTAPSAMRSAPHPRRLQGSFGLAFPTKSPG